MKISLTGTVCSPLTAGGKNVKWLLRTAETMKPIQCLLPTTQRPFTAFEENDVLTVVGEHVNLYRVEGKIDAIDLPFMVDTFLVKSVGEKPPAQEKRKKA